MEPKTESVDIQSSDQEANRKRRRFLLLATDVVGGIAVIGAATPFVGSMFPSERAKAAGAPVEVDIQDLAPEAMRVVEWRGKPVWIMRRNDEMLAEIRATDGVVSDPHSDVPQQPKYAQNEYRSIKPDVGVCVHPSGLFTQICACIRQNRDGSKLDGRILLSLPRIKVRSCRPCNQRVACSDKSSGSSLQIRNCRQASHRFG